MTFTHLSPLEILVTLLPNDLRHYACSFPDGMPDKVEIRMTDDFRVISVEGKCVPDFLKAILGRKASRQMHAIGQSQYARENKRRRMM